MNSIDLKKNLHKLIDDIKNEDLLLRVFQVLNDMSMYKEGDLINSLSVAERQELYESYNDSLDEKNLIDHQDIISKHRQWLTK